MAGERGVPAGTSLYIRAMPPGEESGKMRSREDGATGPGPGAQLGSMVPPDGQLCTLVAGFR